MLQGPFKSCLSCCPGALLSEGHLGRLQQVYRGKEKKGTVSSALLPTLHFPFTLGLIKTLKLPEKQHCNRTNERQNNAGAHYQLKYIP